MGAVNNTNVTIIQPLKFSVEFETLQRVPEVYIMSALHTNMLEKKTIEMWATMSCCCQGSCCEL